ncbi:MAG: DNA polymerase I [Candidatus Solibacter usitatus]|nr:DNA polymerase I [Candidatus Solibacter usitatus]
MPAPRLFLIDTFNFVFRAYHARARSSAPPMRTSKGLSTEAIFIFHNMMRRLTATHKPDYIAAVFESRGKTFREEQFTEYKANREEMPQDLGEQIPYVQKLLEAQRVAVLQFEGFEADDVIGTIARAAEARGVETIIVSSDKDMLQLVNEHVRMLNPMKDDAIFDIAATTEFMGVPPSQVADLLALKGDAVDNIPGAPGIGDKGAKEILAQFGSVEAALDGAAGLTKRTQRESLLNNRPQVELSKRLTTIETAVPIAWSLESLAVCEPDADQLRALYRDLEFFSLLKEVGPADAPSAGDWGVVEDEEAAAAFVASLDGSIPTAVVLAEAAPGELALESMLGLAQENNRGRAVPEHLFGALAGFLSESPKITYDCKSFLRALPTAAGFTRDIMIEAFLIHPDPGAASLQKLSERYLDRRLSGSAEQQAACVVELAQHLSGQFQSRPGLRKLCDEIELPLSRVLAEMERTGIRIESAQLARLSERMDAEIQRLTTEIHTLAGHPFNINSTQQLSKVLFEELNVPAPFKYVKGKQTSTAADVLEELQDEYPIAGKVLEYRQLTKLKGTYVDTLPQRIEARTGRLHTSFHQTGAATGRLSSTDPNLQNIPIRTELGREIRAAFVPREGWKMLVADYSQIELRLLAHLSQDPVLMESFRNGEDIHTRTASEVFGISAAEVNADMRRMAKAVNFGIVYGQTSFGLAGQLGIPRAQADTYIRNYFERYQGVRKYIDDTIAEVRRTGLSVTMFGRERPIPDIASRNTAARGFAERIAVNTPMQGGAADLIKLAMLRIRNLLETKNMRTKMLLQVHDELVLESPPEEVESAAAMVRREMESVREFSVPIVVETGIGDNWRDAK